MFEEDKQQEIEALVQGERVQRGGLVYKTTGEDPEALTQEDWDPGVLG